MCVCVHVCVCLCVFVSLYSSDRQKDTMILREQRDIHDKGLRKEKERKSNVIIFIVYKKINKYNIKEKSNLL